MSNNKFEVKYLPPVDDFLDEIGARAARKIFFNISVARIRPDPRLLKKIDQVFWEFRTEYNGIQYRLLAFWDKRDKLNTLIIATHGFIKKTNKIPGNELIRAYNIREKYLQGDYE